MLLAFGAVTIASCYIGIKVSSKIINPLTTYSLIWGMIVILYQFRLSRWQQPLEPNTYLVLASAQFFFTLAYCCGIKLARCKRVRRLAASVAIREIKDSTVYKLFIFWLCVEIIEIVYSGGMPLFWTLSGSEKTYFDFGIPSLHGIMNAIGLIIIGSLVWIISDNKSNDNKKAPLLLILAISAYYCLIMTRQVLVSAAIEAIVLLVIRQRNILKWLFPCALLGIVAFGILGNIRTGYDEFLYVAQIETNVPAPLVGFYWVYMYLTMTIANINQLVLSGVNAIGIEAFNAYLPSILRSILNAGVQTDSSAYLVTPAFNVSGYFSSFYLGFGMLGVIIITAIYGLLGGVTYQINKNQGGWTYALIYACAFQIVALSFFDNLLLDLPNSFQIVVVLAVSILAKRERRSVNA